MYNVKNNFKNQYGQALSCDLCKIEIDSQEHLLKCKVLEHLAPEIELRKHVQYAHIFGSPSEVIQISKLFSKLCQEREKTLQMFNN